MEPQVGPLRNLSCSPVNTLQESMAPTRFSSGAWSSTLAMGVMPHLERTVEGAFLPSLAGVRKCSLESLDNIRFWASPASALTGIIQ